MHQGKEESIWEIVIFLFAIKMEMSPYVRQTGWVKNKNNIHGCQLLFIFFVQCKSYICWLDLQRYSSLCYDLSALTQNNIVHGK